MDKEEVLIKNIYLLENKIFLETEKTIDKLCLKSFNSSLLFKVVQNTIDLEQLIKENASFFEYASLCKVCAVKDNNSLVNLKIQLVDQAKKEYICKGVHFLVNEDVYNVDIYLNSVGEINIEINIGNDEKPILAETIYADDRQINLSVALPKTYMSSLTSDVGSCLNSKVLLFSQDNNILEYKCKAIDKNILHFAIGFDSFPLNKDNTFKAVLRLEGRYPKKIRLKKNIHFKRVKLIDKTTVKSLIVTSDEEHNELAFIIDSRISVLPKVDKVHVDNEDVIIEGTLNSTLYAYDHPSIKAKLRLINTESNIQIADDINVEKDRFLYKIRKSDIFELKKVAYGSWNMNIDILRDGQVIDSKPLKYVDESQVVLISNELYNDRDTSFMELFLEGEEKNLQLKIAGRVTIKQILNIRVSGSRLKIKYRTRENVEALLDKKDIRTSIMNSVEELKCQKVVKLGKKTYACYYTANDIKKFMDETFKNGLALITAVDGKEYTNLVPEINKYSVYFSFMEHLVNSRKYKILCIKLYNKLFTKMPIKKKRVIFESFLGRNMSGNPKYIYNYFVENGLDKEYELIWSLNDLNEDIPGNVKKVKRKTLKYYYYMATSGYWVLNARHLEEIQKRQGVTFLQTWHGTPLKKLGDDMFNVTMAGMKDINQYKEKFFKSSRQWDYLIAQNDYSAEIFKRAFRFYKKMLDYGYPANDILYRHNNKEDIDKLKDRLRIPKDKKVILYAPTWREDNFYQKGHYKATMELNLDKMQEKLGEEYVLLLKMHYLITNSINIENYKGFAFDLSQNSDIQELYLISDILITDYSSVMFDYSNLKRPIIFFTYDWDKYMSELRGAYFDLKAEAPGPIVKTTDEVVDSILNYKKLGSMYIEKQQNFYNKFCHIDDGKAAERVVNEVFLHKKEK
ncbi:CDP-glycerol glycerophosphotransferase family protein [Clostridium oryzae]|uniref:CDP-glycerol:poly(Glycerophosphate) glycerophosphotransferase n=1 Tax=Clostridium oryzae TaxID=1450648 RepID=A0A1V4IQ82_9CLOT|nr:CDP-glycerol glycerophosphotransferase family protein [Clostridium oryzae]OPJ61637.1 CDP-glycerol:poly(glycerophosphate) glycerophosphotransferase [Clostridium oryzae]